MKLFTRSAVLLFLGAFLFAGCQMFKAPEVSLKPPAFHITAPGGETVTQDDMLNAAATANVILVGETHNNPAAHHLEYAILKKILEKREKKPDPPVILSLEMLARDLQTVTDEYLNDTITEMHFMAASRPWGNYMRAYRRIVNLAKEKKIPVIAANAPRRYVNLVSRKGKEALSALSPEAKKWIAPLPYGGASEPYLAKLKALEKTFQKTTHATEEQTPHPKKRDEGAQELPPQSGINPDAQSLWDATMAFSISEALKKWPEALVLHINGAFHSEKGLGIPEHLARYAPEAKVVIITIRPSGDKHALDSFRAMGPVTEYTVNTL